jgi:hypothetical protein
MAIDLLARIRRNPFLHFDIERVRALAFENSEQRKRQGQSPDAVEDWLAAEREETIAQADPRLVAVHNTDYTDLAGKDFDRFYELANAVTFPTYEPQKKRLIGTPDPRRCSLCGNDPTSVTFRKEAHVLPEAVGSRWLITCDECDTCNERYGREAENELGKMLLTERVMACVPTKTASTAKLKMWDEASSIGGQKKDQALEIALRPGDDSVKVHMTGDREMTIEAKTMPFRPVPAIKSLARSAWHLLPARGPHDPMRRWIRGEFAILPVIFWRFFVPGPGLLHTTLAVWTRSDDAEHLPPLVLAFALGNTVIVWAAPDWSRQAHIPALLPRLPRPLFPNTSLSGQRLAITRDDRVKPEAVKYEVRFADQGLAWSTQPIQAIVEARVANGTYTLQSQCATPRSIEETQRDGVLYEVSGGELVGALIVQRAPVRRRALDLEMPLEVTYSFAPRRAGGDLVKTRAFVEALLAGGEVHVSEAAGPRVLFSVPGGEQRAVTHEFLDRAFRICDAVGTVNGEFNVSIAIDPAGDPQSERNALLLATAISNEGIAGELAPGGTVTWLVEPAALRSTLDAIAGGPHVWVVTTFAYPVFGTELAPGPERITLENARLVRSREELLAATTSEDDAVAVDIACDRIVHTFERWSREKNGA